MARIFYCNHLWTLINTKVARSTAVTMWHSDVMHGSMVKLVGRSDSLNKKGTHDAVHLNFKSVVINLVLVLNLIKR
jgi:hypothetical protein